MQTNEIGLRSQQLTADIAGQREQALEQQGQEWMQGLPNISRSFMEGRAAEQQFQQSAEKHQQDMMLGDSKLASDQLQRQQAAEELQWTQALHQTDMLGYRKEVAKAQANLAIAQAKKAQDDLSGVSHDPHLMTPDILAGLWSIGLHRDPASGRMIDATPEQKAAGEAYESKKTDWHTQAATIQAAERQKAEQDRNKTTIEAANIRAAAGQKATETRKDALIEAAKVRATAMQEAAKTRGATGASEARAHAEAIKGYNAELQYLSKHVGDVQNTPEDKERMQNRIVEVGKLLQFENDAAAKARGFTGGGSAGDDLEGAVRGAMKQGLELLNPNKARK